MNYRIARGLFDRWVIYHPKNEELAWSGLKWVPAHYGVPSGDFQICNFATREEAEEYAKERFPQE
jgi:hypothetical protein